jgi:Ca2+-binding RTX toxin-like protein
VDPFHSPGPETNITFGSLPGDSPLVGVDNLVLEGGGVFNLGFDGTVLNGGQLTVDATHLTSQLLDLNAPAESGQLTVLAGGGNETVTGATDFVASMGYFQAHGATGSSTLDLSHLAETTNLLLTVYAGPPELSGLLDTNNAGGEFSNFSHLIGSATSSANTLWLNQTLGNATVDLATHTMVYVDGTVTIDNFENVTAKYESPTANPAALDLIGDAGNNVLEGGLGADTLAGGGGDDTFRISDTPGLMKTITDFNPATDQIELATDASGQFLALGPNGPLAGARFIHDTGTFTGTYSATLTQGMNAAFDAGQAVIVQDATGTLYFDPHGHDGTGYSAIAHVDPVISAAQIHLHH